MTQFYIRAAGFRAADSPIGCRSFRRPDRQPPTGAHPGGYQQVHHRYDGPDAGHAVAGFVRLVSFSVTPVEPISSDFTLPRSFCPWRFPFLFSGDRRWWCRVLLFWIALVLPAVIATYATPSDRRAPLMPAPATSCRSSYEADFHRLSLSLARLAANMASQVALLPGGRGPSAGTAGSAQFPHASSDNFFRRVSINSGLIAFTSFYDYFFELRAPVPPPVVPPPPYVIPAAPPRSPYFAGQIQLGVMYARPGAGPPSHGGGGVRYLLVHRRLSAAGLGLQGPVVRTA